MNDNVLNNIPYKELVGSLIYVMVCTRPDIAFCVSCLTTYFSEPKQIHWDTAMRCLGYLKATDSFGLILGNGGDPSITCYSDSDWASNPITRRSIGVMWFILGLLLSFGLRKHRRVFWHYLRLNQNILRWLWQFGKFYFYNQSLLS